MVCSKDRKILDNCVFCGKLYTSAIGLGNHKARCPQNPNRKLQELTPEGKERRDRASRGRIWSKEQREKLSISMKAAVLQNPESYTASNVCGRVKIEEYKGEKFHGKWEVEVAIWLDKENIKWIRQIEPKNYYWNNGWHLYFPDFYLPDYDLYIEVKGYETERDRCKWSVVPNLVVLKNKEIKMIRENEFTTDGLMVMAPAS